MGAEIKMKLTTFALSAIVLTFTSLCSAQRNKLPLEVSCTNEANDFVGARFCSSLRDDIARSPRYEAASTGTRWRLHIVTLADAASPKSSSSQAIVLTMQVDSDEIFLMQWAFQSGADTVNEQTQSLLSAVDSNIQELIDAYSKSKKDGQ
jgi:hypothetical protein